MKKSVLGVNIDDITVDEAVKTVEGWLEKSEKHYIVTTNPEFLLIAQTDSKFKRILNNADLAVPDGNGLKIGTDIVCNTPGIDLTEELCKMAAEKGATVGFLGAEGRVVELTAERLKKKYPKLKVSYISEEPIEIPKTDVLFVALGAPKQEFWIAENLDKIPVKVAMGVGGSFDFISGKVPRAPKWLRDLRLEWLFRLIIQPWRIKRQIRLIKYLYLVMVH